MAAKLFTMPADFPAVLVARVLGIASLVLSCLITFEFWPGYSFQPFFIPVEVFEKTSIVGLVLAGAVSPALIVLSTLVQNPKVSAALAAVSLAFPVLLAFFDWDYSMLTPGSGSLPFDLMAFALIGGCALLSAVLEKDLSVFALLASAVLVVASVVVVLLEVESFYGAYTSASLSASLNWIAVSLLTPGLLSALCFKMAGKEPEPCIPSAPAGLRGFVGEKASACDAPPAGFSAGVAEVAEELKAFKELLDMGAITQEDYDAKKKELLGL